MPTCGGASSGYCAIGSVGMASRPARMMTSEQTEERMGRLMKVSTNIRVSFAVGECYAVGGQDAALVRTQPGAALRPWRNSSACRRNGSAVGELLHTFGDHTLAVAESVHHRVAVADNRAQLHRTLPRHLAIVLLLGHEDERLAA